MTTSKELASKELAPVVIERVADSIFLLRGQRVLLDADLAALYGVQTRRLNEQVRRNSKRFPTDFIFELTAAEFANLKPQFSTSSWDELERKLASHDQAITGILKTIRELMNPPVANKRSIGFVELEEKKPY